MKITLLFIQMREIFVVGIMMMLLFSTTVLAKTYRWLDEEGKIYYSHNIPPSAAQNGHTEMNESGRVVNDIASREEREKERQQQLLLEKKEKQKQLEMRETLSLQLFNSRAEVVKHFERRLEMVSVNLRLLQYHKRKLLKDIKKLQKRISAVKTNKERRTLSKRLQQMQSTLLEHSRAIENNRRDQMVTYNNKKRALSKYDNKSTESTQTDSMVIGNTQNTSACSCVCDKNQTAHQPSP